MMLAHSIQVRMSTLFFSALLLLHRRDTEKMIIIVIKYGSMVGRLGVTLLVGVEKVAVPNLVDFNLVPYLVGALITCYPFKMMMMSERCYQDRDRIIRNTTLYSSSFFVVVQYKIQNSH